MAEQRKQTPDELRREQERLGLFNKPVEQVTAQDIDRMVSDDYRKRLRDPAFEAKVNEIEAARGPRPRAQ